MPIKPENEALYPGGSPRSPEWLRIREQALIRAAYKCESCGVPNHTYRQGYKGDPIKIVLTVAHLDHNPRNNVWTNLKVLCQKCHNLTDQADRIQNRKNRREEQAGHKTKEHSTDLSEKLRVREEGMAAFGELPDDSRIFMPFCGFGGMAEAMRTVWPEDRIDAFDIDAACVREWDRQFPLASCRLLDAVKYVFDPAAVYGVADLDAYGSPLKVVSHYLHYAHRAERSLLVLTDGSGYAMHRGKRCYDFEALKFGAVDSVRMDEQLRNWPTIVEEWLRSRVDSVELIASGRGGGNAYKLVWYMAYVIEGGAVRPQVADALPEAVAGEAAQIVRAEDIGMGVDEYDLLARTL